MCNGAAIYFHDRFHQTTAAAGAVAGLYGMSAIFARGLGGYFSDALNQRLSMRGRLLAQMLSMIVQGLSTIYWARLDTLGPSIFMMVVVSIVVQTSIGTCFSIVPYVDGPNTGSVAGIVGAGGKCTNCAFCRDRISCYALLTS
jgi:NNP family nitrate/nitrite transporter-like MFS transporter